MKIKTKQQISKKWFIKLQKLICNNIEELEKIYGSTKKFKKINGSMVNLERLKAR